jgi:hypothetical protein
MFYEKSAPSPMIKLDMDVSRQVIYYLNQGHITVTTIDQPLSQCDVRWLAHTDGNVGYIRISFGKFRLEIALTKADVTSSGLSDSFLMVSHLT